jgi:Protein of unknown function (DUF3667)
VSRSARSGTSAAAGVASSEAELRTGEPADVASGEAEVPTGAPTDVADENAGRSCLDCGATLHGPFCHVCGQRVETRLVPLRRLVGSALDEVFGLETRVARTLRLLFRRPGALTLEFWAGRRARQTPPFRLYLLASLVYFLALEASGSTRFFFLNVTSTDGAGPMGGLVARLPRMMFLLLPAFAALVALLYRRSGRLYAEHVVFALHYHAAAFLILPIDAFMQPIAQEALAAGSVPVIAVTATLAGAAQLGVLVYLFLALRRVYGGGRIGTFVRTVALFVSYLIVLVVVSVISLPQLRGMVWGILRGLLA